MDEIAGWIAPAATMIAAMMTAANLGARVTGWGFVIFSIGSVAWCAVALATGQTNLLASNIFLTLVNLVGIWRWLGRRARFADSAAAAEVESKARDAPDLFAATKLDGMVVTGAHGAEIGRVVDAMLRCGQGGVSYLIIRVGGTAGVGESLRKLDWDDVRLKDGTIATDLDARAVAALTSADPERMAA